MVRVPPDTVDPNREPPELPDGAAHIIVAHGAFSADAPPGHPADRLTYEPGDEVPFAIGREHAPELPRTLAVVDADGELLAGALSLSLEEFASVRQQWETSGFDPTEYDADD